MGHHRPPEAARGSLCPESTWIWTWKPSNGPSNTRRVSERWSNLVFVKYLQQKSKNPLFQEPVRNWAEGIRGHLKPAIERPPQEDPWTPLLASQVLVVQELQQAEDGRIGICQIPAPGRLPPRLTPKPRRPKPRELPRPARARVPRSSHPPERPDLPFLPRPLHRQLKASSCEQL